GWAARDTAKRFAEYAAIVAGALGGQVSRWITLNEPQVVAHNGYRTGAHAPGVQDNAAAVAATHHLLLGHGMAARALRDRLPSRSPVGTPLDRPPGQADGAARAGAVEPARRVPDADLNGLFLEPVLHSRYPAMARPDVLPPAALIADGDMELIGQPVDFLGV